MKIFFSYENWFDKNARTKGRAIKIWCFSDRESRSTFHFRKLKKKEKKNSLTESVMEQKGKGTEHGW